MYLKLLKKKTTSGKKKKKNSRKTKTVTSLHYRKENDFSVFQSSDPEQNKTKQIGYAWEQGFVTVSQALSFATKEGENLGWVLLGHFILTNWEL